MDSKPAKSDRTNGKNFAKIEPRNIGIARPVIERKK